RYKYWYLVAIVLIVGGIQFLIPTPPGKITESNFDKIEKGMTQTEVEEILGPGADRTAHSERVGPVMINGIGHARGHAPQVWKYWDGDEGTIAVRFADGKVLDKNWRPAISLWKRLKEELGW